MQTSLVREAITELLIVNPSLAARLAKAIEPKAKKGKKLVYVVDHSENCYCVDCAPFRLNGLRSQMAELTTFIFKGANAPAPRFIQAPDRSAELERLSMCACGHAAHYHAKDELENLLECGRFIDENDTLCGCDHFHYQIEESRAA